MCFMFLRFVRTSFLFLFLEKLELRSVLNLIKIVMIRNGQFVGKGYCSQGLFMLNVLETMIENASTSSAYMIDSCDFWHVG